MLATEALYQLKDDFNDLYQKMNYPKDMTLFYRHEAEGRLHCEVMVYFSPTSATIAKKLSAKPCKTPSMTGLSYLTGSDKAGKNKRDNQSNKKPSHN